MSRTIRVREGGEGKLGCLVSVALFIALGAAAAKAVPVYYSNSEFADACGLIASGGSRKPPELLEREVRDKARELGVLEAAEDKGAVQVIKRGGEAGTCTIALRYERTVDFYGIYQWTIRTDRRISRPIFENLN